MKGHIPEKDGIAADLIIVEQIAMTGKTPLQTLQEIDDMVGTFVTGRVDVHLENEKKNALMNTLRNDPPANFAGQQVTGTSQIDGVPARPRRWLLGAGATIGHRTIGALLL